MDNSLYENVERIHTTELGVKRIKRNLGLADIDVVAWCKEKVKDADDVTRKGKNYYVRTDNAVMTINASSFTIITAHIRK